MIFYFVNLMKILLYDNVCDSYIYFMKYRVHCILTCFMRNYLLSQELIFYLSICFTAGPILGHDTSVGTELGDGRYRPRAPQSKKKEKRKN